MKKIKMTLDPASIGKAIKEVKDYQRELKNRVNLLVTTLIDTGVEIAKVQVAELGAVYTGELQESIMGYFSPSLGAGLIYCGAWYGVYVEFGFGIVGKGSPHPVPAGWEYDVNDHGEAGWWYFNERDGRWHWSKGMRSRPFLWNTARELERICAQVAKEVFGR